jgi:hypothetical protein
VKLTNHRNLVPMPRKCGSIHSPPYSSSCCSDYYYYYYLYRITNAVSLGDNVTTARQHRNTHIRQNNTTQKINIQSCRRR